MMSSVILTLSALCSLAALGVYGEPVFRLPRTVLPTQYKLRLTTDPLGQSFNGEVKIEVHVKESTEKIILHSKNLTINSVTLFKDEGSREVPTDFKLDPERDLLLIDSSKPLQSAEEYSLEVNFEGKLNNGSKGDLAGYYNMKTGNSDINWMSTTVFEMVRAREAFPCWDEPQIKARFLVSLKHATTHKALSNMPLSHSEQADEKGWIIDHFENTPLMSTYLVTFILTQWEHIEIKSDDGRPLRLWARADRLPRGQRHLDFARRALAWLQNYTGVQEPMPKIDLVVVPRFPGALENWGAISFGPQSLLERTPRYRGDVEMATVAHELTHSWFGNLVSPHWWDSLWLSEGAASFFSALAVNDLIPGYNHLNENTLSYQSTTLLYNMEAIEQPLNPSIDDMEKLLDMPYNVYYHGSSLFNMLYNVLGPDHLRAGIHRYLSALQYDSGTPQKLYDALRYQWQDKQLSELMAEWTYRGGFPLVTVTRSKEKITLAQERFIASYSNEEESAGKDIKWWVPVSFTTQTEKNFKDARPKLWFKDTVTIPDPADDADWIIFNINAAGIYIVKYDDDTWNVIQKSLASPDFNGIPELMRAKLFLDHGLLSLQGTLNINKVWKMHELLNYEKADGPWEAASFTYRRLNRRLRGTPAGDLLEGQMKRLMYNRIKAEGGQFDVTSRIGKIFCVNGLPECVERSVNMFHDWTSDLQTDSSHLVPRDVKLAVYCSAMRASSDADWHLLLERALQSQDIGHRDAMFSALGCTEDIQSLNKLLENQLTSPTMTRRDWTYLLRGMIQHSTDVSNVLEYLRTALPSLRAVNNINVRFDKELLRDLAEQIVEPVHVKQFTDVTTQVGLMKYKNAFMQQIEHQIQWRKTNMYF